jgi:hypothetical protein
LSLKILANANPVIKPALTISHGYDFAWSIKARTRFEIEVLIDSKQKNHFISLSADTSGFHVFLIPFPEII